jgi:hypothetical protein
MTVLLLLLCALGAILCGLGALALREIRAWRREAAVQAVLTTFGPAQAAAQQDARALLVWQPLADSARRLWPGAFAELDTAMGNRFPFPKDVIERAHSKWTADWLAWEKTHDEEYRLKAATAEHEMGRVTGEAASLAKARLDRIQHEKIELYQQRYESYVRTAKALQALVERVSA